MPSTIQPVAPTTQCKGLKVETGTTGTISDGPGDYDRQMDCSWRIAVNGGTVHLRFDNFTVEDGYDFVDVFDVSDASASLIGTYTGSLPSFTVVSTSASMFVHFRTDVNSAQPGFEADWSSQGGSAGCEACSEGSVSLAGSSTCTHCAPGEFPNTNQEECIACAPGKHASVLTYDCLECPAGQTSFARSTECSHCPNGRHSSTAGSANCTACAAGSFPSGSEQAGAAAAAHAAGLSTPTVACSGAKELVSNGGVIASGPLDADHNMQCTWKLTVPFGKVNFKMTKINLESGFDYVKVYDGADMFAPKLANFTGDRIPDLITSSGSTLFIKFVTDADVVSRGFSATWYGGGGADTCALCPTGHFSSAGDAHCHACAAGTFATHHGSPSCTDCPTGKHGLGVGSACKECLAGRFADTARATTCAVCLDGTISAAGDTTCTACPCGKFGNTENTVCTECGEGQYTTAAGAMECSICPAGKFKGTTGAQCTCSTCAPGKFAQAGANSCTDCPLGQFHPSTGTSCINCAK